MIPFWSTKGAVRASWGRNVVTSEMTNKCLHNSARGALSTRTVIKTNGKKSNMNLSTSAGEDKEEATGLGRHVQKFVKSRLTPGEWDVEKKDPLYRPPWKNRAKIMSAEDFANRPKVVMEEEFASLHDGMVVLSWLTQQQRDDIYESYLKMMQSMSEDSEAGGVTSHEYVMRVIGQKFNITAMRVAAIVQMKHTEEQLKKERERDGVNDDENESKKTPELNYKVQEYVDAKIREHIKNVYKMYEETDPMQFVEDPVGVAGTGNPELNTNRNISAEDLYDIDLLTHNAILREKDEAQLAIDGHLYIEDADDTILQTLVDNECRDLIRRKNELFKTQEQEQIDDHLPNPLPHGGLDDDGNPTHRRPRWKYVAKTINTRQQKQKNVQQKRKLKRTKNKHDNTIVEENGILRVATVKELSNTAWKPPRNPNEFAYQNVKAAWLNRKFRGESGGWGHVNVRDAKQQSKQELKD